MLLAKQFSWAICALLVCATTAEVTHAQGGGRGGFGGPRTRFELATLSEVQTELKLNEEQKKMATEQLTKMREKRAAMFQGGGGGGGGGQAARTELAKMNADMDAAFVGKLDDTQKSRMNGLIAQVNGGAAVLDAAIAKAMELNDDLIAKLKAVNDANQSARREAMQGFRDMSPEQRTEATAKLTASENKSIMALLSEAQVKKLDSIKGAALTIDESPLRPARRNQ
jgi:hypothetical protein